MCHVLVGFWVSMGQLIAVFLISGIGIVVACQTTESLGVREVLCLQVHIWRVLRAVGSIEVQFQFVRPGQFVLERVVEIVVS